MSDYMTKPLTELAKDIIADGIVDADEVAKIRERLYADGIIDRDEAEFLFTINDAVSGKINDAGWKKLFVEALTSHVLEDEESPGEIDEDEANWLIQKIQSDGQIDDCEKALLLSIKQKAKSIHNNLNSIMP